MSRPRPPTVGVLGPTVLVDGRTLSPSQRRLLAALVVVGPDGAGLDALVPLVWPDGAPRTARASLQNQVTRLRQLLDPAAVRWAGGRYRLDPALARTDVDVVRDLLGTLAVARDEDDDAVVLDLAAWGVDLFRGRPYDDLADRPVVRRQRRHLSEVRDLLHQDLAEALLRAGRAAEATNVRRRLVEAQPHDEARWVSLIETLHTSGRRSDALAAYREARTVLREDLGLEPGVELAAAHRAILDGRSPRAPRPPAVRDPVVPRPDVLAQVADLLTRDRLAVLTGDPGIGKTTLLPAIADDRPGGGVVRVRCLTNPWSALQPLHDVVAALSSTAAAADPPPERPPQGLVAQVADTLTGLLTQRPVTVVLDDAGLAGPTTWRVLGQLLDECPDLRVLAVTRSPTELPAALADAPSVVMAGLMVDEVDRLVGALLRRPNQVGPLARWAHRVTGGNALFVRELVHELDRTGAIVRGPEGLDAPVHVPLSQQLRQVVEQRLAAFPLQGRRALDVLAVLGEAASDVLDPLGAPPRSLDDVVRQGVAVEDAGVWRFRHEVVRSVALAAVPTGRRLELEIAAALLLEEQGASAAAVATHRLAAAEVDPLAAAMAAGRAAHEALAAGAHDEAAAWGDRGLALLAPEDADGPLAVDLAVVVADARRLSGAPHHAEGVLDAATRAMALDDDVLRRRAVLATLRLGSCCQPGKDQQRAVRLGEEALAREPSPVGRAVIHASLSLTHSMVDATASREHFDRAVEVIEADGAPEDVVLEILPYAYMSVSMPDDVERRGAFAVRLARASHATDDPIGRFEASHLAFSTALQRGDGAAMRAAHDDMRAVAHRAADVGRRWSLAYQQATLLQVAGDLDAAEAAAGEALTVGLLVAEARASAAWAGQLLELRRLQGRLDELVEVVDGLLAQPGALPAWRAAGALVLASARPDEARRLVHELVDTLGALPRDFAYGSAVLCLARAAAELRLAEPAAVLLGVLTPWAHLMSWQGTTTYGPYGRAVAALGELLDDPEAVAHGAAGAAAATRRLGSPVYDVSPAR